MNFKNRIRILLSALVLLYACSPALYLPVEADVTRTGTPIDSLLTGRALYVKHCGSCHNLRVPEKYTQKEWLEKLPVMQHKAKISEDETMLITNFILARSKPE